jgi:uncharacterized membrane protein
MKTEETKESEPAKEPRFSKTFINSFFCLYFVIGLGLMSLSPPFQSADAFAHFNREVGIASGQLIATTQHGSSGSYLPSGVLWLEDGFSTIPFNPFARASEYQFHDGIQRNWNTPKIFVQYTTGGNIPFLYVPQVLGVLIGKFFSPHILVSYYLAELMNLLAFVALARWALFQFPRRLAFPLGIFLLLPTVISVAISVNPDSLLLSLSLVFAASCFTGYSENLEGSLSQTDLLHATRQSIRSRKKITRAYCIAFISLFLMTLEKPPLVFLGLLLPLADLYSNLRRYLVRAVAFMGSVSIAYSLWSIFGARGAGGPIPQSSFAPARQIRLMITDPLKDVEVVGETLRKWGWLFWKQLIAGIGWLDVSFPTWVYVSLSVAFIFSVLSTQYRRRGDVSRFAWSLLVLVITATAISFSLYVSYNSYAASAIYGLQGRYYLPLIPPMIVILGLQRTRTPTFRIATTAASEYAAILLISVQLLIATEYVVILLSRYWYK